MRQFASLEDILGVLRRRFALISFVIALGVLLSVVFALNQPRAYEATAVVQIELATIGEDVSSPATTPRAKYRLQLIEQQLMARDSLLALIDELGLFADRPQMTVIDKVVALRESVSITQIIAGGETWRPDAVPSGLYITARSSDPEQAAEMANAFLARLLAQAEIRRTEQVRETLAFFESEAVRVGGKITELENRIAVFKGLNAASLPDGIMSLKTQLATLQETELDLESQIIALRNSGSRVREETLNRQIADLEQQKSLVAARIADIDLALANAPQVERDLNQLGRELQQLQDQFAAITAGRAEAEMGQMLERTQQAERFEVLETALVPSSPVSASRKRIVFLGLVLSTMLAGGIVLVLELMNPVIRTPRQLEAELGVAPVVAIPKLSTTRRPRRRGRRLLLWLMGIGAALAALWSAVHRTAQSALGDFLRARRAARAGGEA
jgi:tyrosine-protein kinase Etk/Wzc